MTNITTIVVIKFHLKVVTGGNYPNEFSFNDLYHSDISNLFSFSNFSKAFHFDELIYVNIKKYLSSGLVSTAYIEVR